MAKTTVDAGFSVVGYNRSEAPVEELVQYGGRRADDPEAVAAAAPVVSIVVRDDAEVRDVVLGEGGLVDGFADGGIVLVHSTVHPTTIRTLDRATPSDVDIVDAPVSGLSTRAERGELTLMVGGDPEAIDYCVPLLEALGAEIVRMGGVGSGAAGKLVNNLVAYATVAATVEGVKVGTAFGIEEERLIELFANSSANNFYIENWEFVTNEWSETHPGGLSGLADMASEELLQALRLADDVDVDVPVTAIASQVAPGAYRSFDDL